MNRSRFAALLVFAMGFSVAAQAATWPVPAVACLPERAHPWDSGKSENAQASCHCPDPNKFPCPTDYRAYYPDRYPDIANGQVLPVKFFMGGSPACCTPPTCPAGTKLAGKQVPVDGNCNPTEPETPDQCSSQAYGAPVYAEDGGDGSQYYFALAYRHLTELPKNLASADAIAHFSKDENGNYLRKETAVAGPYSNGKGIFAYYFHPHDVADSTAEINSFADACRGTGEHGLNIIECDPHTIGKDNCRIIVPQTRHPFGNYVGLSTVTSGNKQCTYFTCSFGINGGTETSCVTGNTKITMADGSTKQAVDLKVGDAVKGSDGAHIITAANRYSQENRTFYRINDRPAMITDFHPIKTTEGWKVINPKYAGRVTKLPGFAKTPLTIGDRVITETGPVEVKSLEPLSPVGAAYSYNIQVDHGDGDFYANGIEVKGFREMEMHY